MAGANGARGGLGWVILAIALAVPGVLFYNWWSHLKAEREKTVAAKARGRVPEGGVFTAPPPSAKLVNPMTPTPLSTAPAAGSEPAPAPGAATTASAAVLAAPGAQSPAAVAAPAVAVSTVAPAAAVAVSTAAPAPPLKRDPTLSPFDQVRLLEEEEARRKAAEDLANAAKPRSSARRGPAPPKDPRTLVNLQGIVSNPDSGFKAIVNDEVLGAGEFVGSTKVRIVKITDLGVTFDYKGKKFSLGVSRD